MLAIRYYIEIKQLIPAELELFVFVLTVLYIMLQLQQYGDSEDEEDTDNDNTSDATMHLAPLEKGKTIASLQQSLAVCAAPTVVPMVI